MTDDVIELSRRTASKVDRILSLLEGDDYRPGLLQHVSENRERIARNRQSIERIWASEMSSSVSASTLLGVAWLGLVLAPALMVMDRLVLISDYRHALGIKGVMALALSTVLGSMAMGVLIFVVMVFTLRWLGWGQRRSDDEHET